MEEVTKAYCMKYDLVQLSKHEFVIVFKKGQNQSYWCKYKSKKFVSEIEARRYAFEDNITFV